MARNLRPAIMLLLAASVALAAVLLHPTGQARAAASGYVFDGGTARERWAVRAALDASAFDWKVVPAQVTIHITPGPSHAERGQIWLDPKLLAHGKAAWGVVQHEYAHQVDFFLLNDRLRARLGRLLHANTWWSDGDETHHSQYGCERFASTLALAYWPSPANTLARYAHAESTAMPHAKLRRLMAKLLAARS